MALTGIDAQIALQRSTTYLQENVAQMRRGETTQDFLAVKNKLESEREQLQVQHLDQKEKAKINKDPESKDQSNYQGSKKKKQAEKQPGLEAKNAAGLQGKNSNSLEVGTSEKKNTIDILV